MSSIEDEIIRLAMGFLEDQENSDAINRLFKIVSEEET
jgi:hypothetical protein